MDKNIITNVQNGKIDSGRLEKLMINRVVNDYFKLLSEDIKTKNINVIDKDKYILIYDKIYGARIRIKLSRKLQSELNCHIKHEIKKILCFKKDIFQIIY